MTAHGIDRSGAAGGSGSVHTVVDEGFVDAKGDLLVGASADQIDNLTVGTDDYILVADSTADLGVAWAEPVAVFQSTIDAATAETTPAIGDLILLSDVSLTPDAGRKMTLENTLKVVNGLTEDTTPDATADYILTYDTSASAAKKVKPSQLGKWVEGGSESVGTGTSASKTGIPSDAKEVVLVLDSISTNGTSPICLRGRHAGGTIATGYNGSIAAIGSAAASCAAASTGADIYNATAAGSLWSGTIRLKRKGTTNIWAISVNVARHDDAMAITNVAVDITAALDGVVLTTNGGANVFDGGTWSMAYRT